MSADKPTDPRDAVVTTLALYDADARRYAERYGETVPDGIARCYRRWIPPGAETLELGCGNGRDARFLTRMGVRVTATDGAPRMLAEAQRRTDAEGPNTETAPHFSVLQLPPEDALFRTEEAALAHFGRTKPFDAVTAVGVLQHLTPEALRQTARLIVSVLSSEGVLILSVPTSHTGDEGRFYSNLPAEHYVALFESLGLSAAWLSPASVAGPAATPGTWRTIVFLREQGRRRAGTSLFGIVENDSKTATYKLGLLKALCDVNRRNPGQARWLTDDEMRTHLKSLEKTGPKPPEEAARVLEDAQVAVPLFSVMERWIENYWMLFEHEVRHRPDASDVEILQSAPRQIQGNRPLGFGRPLFALMRHYRADLLHFQTDFYGGKLRPDFETSADEHARLLRARTLFKDLADAVATTLKKGPVYYAGNSLASNAVASASAQRNRIFTTAPAPRSSQPPVPATPDDFRKTFGELRFPSVLWRELHAVGPWLSDSIALEWARLSVRLTEKAGGSVRMGDVLERLEGSAPTTRDTMAARRIYERTLATTGLRCVWSDRELTRATLAVDHAIPWAKSRSNDLWNLLPADRKTNGAKSDRLPAADLLYRQRHRIFDDWRLLAEAYEPLFFAQASGAFGLDLTPDGKRGWETRLFDALLLTADTVADQYRGERWRPDIR